jgi:hypothetical protein
MATVPKDTAVEQKTDLSLTRTSLTNEMGHTVPSVGVAC